MNKLMVILGCVALSNGSITESTGDAQISAELEEPSIRIENTYCVLNVEAEPDYLPLFIYADNEGPFDITAVEFKEIEEEMELGFDTKEYLPEDFNPYEVYINLKDIAFEKDSILEGVDLDTTKYLPEDFDAETEVLPVDAIHFMEEESLELEFDTKEYLPEGFNPHKKHINLKDVEFDKDADALQLGFNSDAYLPINFDAHTELISASAMQFMEEETLELGFDPNHYLPENFDPYKG